MKISLEHISKKFQRYWIFKDINHHFASPGAYALLGDNGSGKSTLLRIISGMQTPSYGKVLYTNDLDQLIPVNKIATDISFCAPAQELVEEFTFRELLDFHFTFKKSVSNLSKEDIVALTGLKDAANKPIFDYSSGMKQRVKLALAIFSDTPVLLLDEPCTNLDQAGVEQYRNWVDEYGTGRLVIVASNDPREYYFCRNTINVLDYK